MNADPDHPSLARRVYEAFALQIRESVYRGKAGFTISGTDGKGRSGQRVFVRSRETAERVKAAMLAGDDALVDSLILGERDVPGSFARAFAEG